MESEGSHKSNHSHSSKPDSLIGSSKAESNLKELEELYSLENNENFLNSSKICFSSNG